MEQEIIDAVNEIRTTWKAGDDKRDSNLPTEIPEVERINDLQYGPNPKWNLLDLYLPKNKFGKLPVIIQIHGGGWVYGTKETYQFYGLGMAKKGFAFVNANYRLGPQVQYPCELDDVNAYIHWIDKHADEYNLDRNNVFLIGDSAGGQMAEQYTTILTNPEYRQLMGYELPNLTFRAVALNSPATFILDPGMIGGATKAYFSDEVLYNKKVRDQLDVEKYITEDFCLPLFQQLMKTLFMIVQYD